MRAVRHWTPRYVACRLATLIYQSTHPAYPWLTPSANRLLTRSLKSGDVGLEFGSGRSTAWIAQRVTHLTSIEHDPVWAEKVSRKLARKKIQNVDFRLHETLADYIESASDLADESLDFCLIDGVSRARCVFESLPKLRPGGLLIIDNANKYLPCESRSPGTRRPSEGPINEDWARLAAEFENWQKTWTTSGITDTAFFYKPR